MTQVREDSPKAFEHLGSGGDQENRKEDIHDRHPGLDERALLQTREAVAEEVSFGLYEHDVN
jgi:hypothetical protein